MTDTTTLPSEATRRLAADDEPAAISLEALQRRLDTLMELLGAESQAEPVAAGADDEPVGWGEPSAASAALACRLGGQARTTAGLPLLDDFLLTNPGRALLAQFEQAWCDYSIAHAEAVDHAMEQEVCWQ